MMIGCHLQWKETNKTRKHQLNYERHDNELGQKKKITQRIPLVGANGRLNKRKIAFKGLVTKKKNCVEIKKDQRYELKQLTIYNM